MTGFVAKLVSASARNESLLCVGLDPDPELMPAIKLVVDRHRSPGRFLLTGSANLLLLPRVQESLAGRMEIVRLNPLAEMIVSHDPEVRANAAMVLGELGDTSAAAMLRQAVRGGVHHASLARTKLVNLQFAEALVKLGQREEISVIRAALFSTPENGELAALACMLTGRLRAEQAIPDLSNLARATGRFQRSAEIRMAATWAMAQINPSFAPIEVPMAYVGSDQYQLRAQAASTLGELGDATVYRTLASLLGDPNQLVQVAAAGAILRVDRTLDKVVRNRPNY